MDAEELHEALALAILGYGTDGYLTIPKSLIDAFAGRNFEIVSRVDWKNEEVTFRILFTN